MEGRARDTSARKCSERDVGELEQLAPEQSSIERVLRASRESIEGEREY